jgi:hypothetical protein
MDSPASCNDVALLDSLRALARRGAMLRRLADGAGRIEQVGGKRPPEIVAPHDLLRLIDAGWLREAGASELVISRRGATVLRNLLNRPRSHRLPGSNGRGEGEDTGPAAQPTNPEAILGVNGGASPLRANRRAPIPHGCNLKESPLAWLAQRRDKDGRAMISSDEVEAGERLRADFERAQMGPRVTSSWSPAAAPSGQARGAPGAGIDIADVVVAARQRVEAALRAVGPELSGVLLDVCCFLKGLEQAERNGGWPRRSGKVVLQIALAKLARHYGLGARGDAQGRIRQWGAGDFRPSMDAPGPDEKG